MDAFLIGGPKHGDVIEAEEDHDTVEGYPCLLQIATAKDQEEGAQWKVLLRAGIEPPVGAWILYYIRLGSYKEPLIYFFAMEEGQPLEEEEEDE